MTDTPRPPWRAPVHDYLDVVALRGLANGTATADEQKRALTYIVSIARTWNSTFYPGSERDSIFSQGMRHVGLSILDLVNMDGERLEELRVEYVKRTTGSKHAE